MKKIILRATFLLLIMLMISCSGKGLKINKVSKIPQNFILLDDEMAQYNDIVSCWVDEAYLCFYDPEGIFFDEDIRLDSKTNIVKCKGKIYIHEMIFEAVIYEAKRRVEARNRIYEIGETIDLYRCSYAFESLLIVSVTYVEILDDVEVNDEEWICLIEIQIENEGNGPVRTILDYVNRLESFDGDIYSNFIRLDKIDYNDVFVVDNIRYNYQGSIAIKLPLGVKAKYLYVTSPDPIDNLIIRKVNIGF